MDEESGADGESSESERRRATEREWRFGGKIRVLSRGIKVLGRNGAADLGEKWSGGERGGGATERATGSGREIEWSYGSGGGGGDDRRHFN